MVEEGEGEWKRRGGNLVTACNGVPFLPAQSKIPAELHRRFEWPSLHRHRVLAFFEARGIDAARDIREARLEFIDEWFVVGLFTRHRRALGRLRRAFGGALPPWIGYVHYTSEYKLWQFELRNPPTLD